MNLESPADQPDAALLGVLRPTLGKAIGERRSVCGQRKLAANAGETQV